MGVFWGYMLTLLISLKRGNGLYSPVSRFFIDVIGNQLGAVLIQTVLCGLLGAIFMLSIFIFEMDHWSITKMTVIHFVIESFSLLPVAYFLFWIDHSLLGVVSYFCLFVAIYFVSWMAQRVMWKNNIKQINERIDINNDK